MGKVTLCLLVLETGLEPVRTFVQQILSLCRLPIPTLEQEYCIFIQDAQTQIFEPIGMSRIQPFGVILGLDMIYIITVSRPKYKLYTRFTIHCEVVDLHLKSIILFKIMKLLDRTE